MMWKISTTVALLLATVQAAHNNLLTEYRGSASNQGAGSYYYPAPPKSQQLHDPVSSQQSAYDDTHTYQNQYQGNYQSISALQRSSVITKQFASPALDNAAFNLALSSQGYTFGNTPALKAESRSSKTTLQTAASSSSSTSTLSSASQSSSPSSSSSPVLGSLNVKLPLPIGVTPLNIAPLPLQSATSYSAIPSGVTSYGTLYPQRRRR